MSKKKDEEKDSILFNNLEQGELEDISHWH